MACKFTSPHRGFGNSPRQSLIRNDTISEHRGLKKHGGALRLNAHVARLLCERGRVTGVVLRDGKIVKARKGVVSNASMWDTQRLLPPELAPAFAPRTQVRAM